MCAGPCECVHRYVALPPDDCPDGKEMKADGRCVECEVGTYRKQGLDPVCTPCPTGRTTPWAGDERENDCNAGKCTGFTFG